MHETNYCGDYVTLYSPINSYARDEFSDCVLRGPAERLFQLHGMSMVIAIPIGTIIFLQNGNL